MKSSNLADRELLQLVNRVKEGCAYSYVNGTTLRLPEK